MKNLFFTSFFFCINHFAFSQWTVQSTNVNSSISDIHFIDNSVGFVSGGSGTVLKTNNGGQIWQLLQPNSGSSFNCIFGLDINTIYTGRQSLRKTTNGNSFFEVSGFDGLGGVKRIHFFNTREGFVINSSGVLKTVDGGITWSAANISPNPSAPLGQLWTNDFQFINTNVGYAFGGFMVDGVSYGEVFQTIDGGNNWVELHMSESNISALYFTDILTGYYASQNAGNSVIYKTTNGGVTWDLIQSFTNEYITDLLFIDNQTGYSITLEGKINKTEDGGLTWINAYTTDGESLNTIEKTPNNTIYVGGQNGLILKNEDLVLSTPEEELSDFVNVYPNPSSESLVIDFNSSLNSTFFIEIYNSTGQRIFRNISNMVKQKINIKSFDSGEYTLKIITEENRYSQKIVIR